MKDLPLVSVIAVCYNQSKYLVETLDSIKNQTYSNIELLIMDDSSTDNSVEVIEDWIERNNYDCKFIAHKENKGLCPTLNEALSHINGDYYQALACDDILFPNKYELQVKAFLEADENYAVVFSDVIFMNANGEWQYEGPRFIQNNYKMYHPFAPNLFNELLVNRNFIPAASVLLSTSKVREIGGYDENLSFEDYDMLLRLSDKFEIKFICPPTAIYRIHENNMTNQLNFNKYLISSFYLLYKQIGRSEKIDNILNQRLYSLLKQLFYNKYENIQEISRLFYQKFSTDKNLLISIKSPFYNHLIYKLLCKIC
jgi:glycosyltransferase involved in cell wall biosynthesis